MVNIPRVNVVTSASILPLMRRTLWCHSNVIFPLFNSCDFSWLPARLCLATVSSVTVNGQTTFISQGSSAPSAPPCVKVTPACAVSAQLKWTRPLAPQYKSYYGEDLAHEYESTYVDVTFFLCPSRYVIKYARSQFSYLIYVI